MVKGLITLSKTFYNAYPQLGAKIRDLGIDLKEFISDKPIPESVLIKNIKDVEIYINGVEKVNKNVIDAAEELKFIAKHGAGLDNLDLKYLTQKEIPVTYTPGQNASSVADFTLALLLAISRKVTQSNAIMKNGGWELMMGTEMEGKTIGIIGFGKIGRKVAERSKGFGMNILAYDIVKNEDIAKKLCVEYVDIDTLLKESDFISINLALTEKTYHMLNKDKFKLMKNTAYLINTSRGPITVEQDLIHALKSGQIQGAALDVFDTEPPNRELISLPNVIATSHIGGSTFECAQRLGDITIDNIRRFLNSEELRFIANPEVIKK